MSFKSNKIILTNEIIIGDIALTSVEEPGMIKWDGEHFKGYTGTSGWINLDLDTISLFDHDVTINGNLIISGDFTVNGTVTSINTVDLLVEDNIVEINSTLTGIPPVFLQSGIKVNRGDYNPYVFIFDETDDTFRIGEAAENTDGSFNDFDLQAVATREDDPISNGISYWDSIEHMFKTNTNVLIDLVGGTGLIGLQIEDVYVNKNSITSWNDALHISVASELAGLSEKTTIVTTDLFLLEDITDNLKKKISWSNILNVITTATNLLYVGLSGDQTIAGIKSFSSFPITPASDPTTDYQVANKLYVDNNRRHTIIDNTISMTDRSGLEFIGFSLSDDDTGDKTIVEHLFGLESNVDEAGISAGDVLQRNATNTGYDFIQSKIFDEILRASESAISSNTQLSIIIPAGYKIDAIVIRETSGNNAGNISIGITNGTDEIVSTEEILANADILAPIGQEYFSSVNDTNLYVSSSSWGTGVITIYVTIKKII